MLPTAHVEFTWATANALQHSPLGRRWQDLDYRLLALAAILPDLMDKPLAIFAFPDSHAALLFGHTILLHLALWGSAAASGRLGRWLPYLLAFSGHLVADRMWGFTRTLLWPLRGRRFHQWKNVGSPNAFLQAYGEIIRTEPKLLILEFIGLALLAWLIADRGLHRKGTLRRFLGTGRVVRSAR